ncbi:MAG: hypothetical protein R3Y62_02990 [Eubacteriales bacterium]
MWMMFGIGAIMTSGLNVMFYITNRKPDLFRFFGISLTALTACSFYAQNKTWVIHEDWSALMDVVPAASTMLWIFVILSILINSISLIKRK